MTLFFWSLKIILFPWKKNLHILLIDLSTINSQSTHQKLKKLSFVAPAFQINFFHLFFLTFSELIPLSSLHGVYLSHTLSPDQHINHLLSQCNQRLYLVSQLKSQNISAQCLDIIFQALILAKITYAIPSFAGLISVTFRSKINKFFHKAHSVDLPLHSLTFRV